MNWALEKLVLVTMNYGFSKFIISVEFTHQQMHFFILKNTLKFTLKYT